MYVLAASALAFTFASCSSDSENLTETATEGSVAASIAKAPTTRCSSNGTEITSSTKWYYYVSSNSSLKPEQMDEVYRKFYEKAPEKGRTGNTIAKYNEPTSEEETEFVMNYLKEHPNEGTKEFNHYNFFIQFVGNNSEWLKSTTGKASTVPAKRISNIMFVDQNGTERILPNYSTDGGYRMLIVNTKIANAKFYGNNAASTDYIGDSYSFYTIEYNGQKNTYLCFDFQCALDKNGSTWTPDGTYNDYVIKVIPACPDEPTTPEEPETPSVTGKGEVEVNLAAQDHKDGTDAKLSIHVRDTCNFETFIPVELKYSCPVDDMFIVEKHYADMSYNENTNTTVTREINGQTVSLNIKYTAAGIYVTSEGINNKVIQYCRNVFGDGLTFEVYTYFNTALTRETLISLLNQSTIAFTDNQPGSYKNTIVATNKDKEGRLLDCTVTKK